MSLFSYIGLLALGARITLAQSSSSTSTTSAAAAATTFPTCYSFGMDFQNGGSYFQDSASKDSFSFVSQFEGCQNDTAYNILVNPNGDQTLCSNTPLQPSDTDETSVCPIEKSSLFNGSWSIIIMSNNGQANPIVYERSFQLSVGTQSTSTYTPTVTASFVSIPVVSTTSTITANTTSGLPSSISITSSTKAGSSITATPTKTIYPLTVVISTTKALLTVKYTAYDANVHQVTKTATATCIKPKRSAQDGQVDIVPTIGPFAQSFGARFRRGALEDANARILEEQKIQMFSARDLDPQPFVVTHTNTADYFTTTLTSTAPATTVTVTTTSIKASASTLSPITIQSGTTTAPIVTVTGSTLTSTNAIYTVATTIITKTVDFDFTITSTITPEGVSQACRSAGGMLY